jgi:hypothetical protein|tara:strand:- start:16793 stop:17248 length:456 start_codon:yes stop_codon:yes gene_type:complete
MNAIMKMVEKSKPVKGSRMALGQKLAFLKALEVTPGNISKACRIAKVSRGMAYHQKKVDGLFSECWDEALNAQLDELEQKQLEVSMDDTHARQWTLSRLRRSKWGDKQLIEVGGEVEHVHSAREIPTDKLESMIRDRLKADAIEAEVIEEA